MSASDNRRPLASRDSGWAVELARLIASTRVTPNQISAASILAAVLAGGCLWLAGSAEGPARPALLLAGAVCCQLRLLCNLLDGMVAVEGGKAAPDGPFWNEFPDRVADILILVGAGLGTGSPELGWAAACMAVLTAYVREFGRASGAPPDFSGPMAKPHRMAAITAAALLSVAEPIWNGRGEMMTLALWVIAIGAAITAISRAVTIRKFLRADGRR